MEREKILQTAMNLTTKVRNKSYGEPQDQMSNGWDLTHAYYNVAKDNPKLTGAHHAAMFQVLNKISRIASGEPKEDNYVDAAAYLAIAGECLNPLEQQAPNKAGNEGFKVFDLRKGVGYTYSFLGKHLWLGVYQPNGEGVEVAASLYVKKSGGFVWQVVRDDSLRDGNVKEIDYAQLLHLVAALPIDPGQKILEASRAYSSIENAELIGTRFIDIDCRVHARLYACTDEEGRFTVITEHLDKRSHVSTTKDIVGLNVWMRELPVRPRKYFAEAYQTWHTRNVPLTEKVEA